MKTSSKRSGVAQSEAAAATEVILELAIARKAKSGRLGRSSRASAGTSDEGPDAGQVVSTTRPARRRRGCKTSGEHEATGAGQDGRRELQGERSGVDGETKGNGSRGGRGEGLESRGTGQPRRRGTSAGRLLNRIILAVSNSTPTGAGEILVPTGVARINGTIVITSRAKLILSAGAVLRRFASGGANTSPVVRLTGQCPQLAGSGSVISEDDSPRGVVCVGPNSLSVAENVSNATVNGIQIVGVSKPAARNVGLGCDSSEKLAGQGQANYYGLIDNVIVSNVDVGLQCMDLVNGWAIQGMRMTNISTYGYLFRGCGLTTVLSGFLSFSPNLSHIIKFESAYKMTVCGVTRGTRKFAFILVRHRFCISLGSSLRR